MLFLKRNSINIYKNITYRYYSTSLQNLRKQWTLEREAKKIEEKENKWLNKKNKDKLIGNYEELIKKNEKKLNNIKLNIIKNEKIKQKKFIKKYLKNINLNLIKWLKKQQKINYLKQLNIESQYWLNPGTIENNFKDNNLDIKINENLFNIPNSNTGWYTKYSKFWRYIPEPMTAERITEVNYAAAKVNNLRESFPGELLEVMDELRWDRGPKTKDGSESEESKVWKSFDDEVSFQSRTRGLASEIVSTYLHDPDAKEEEVEDLIDMVAEMPVTIARTLGHPHLAAHYFSRQQRKVLSIVQKKKKLNNDKKKK